MRTGLPPAAHRNPSVGARDAPRAVLGHAPDWKRSSRAVTPDGLEEEGAFAGAGDPVVVVLGHVAGEIGLAPAPVAGGEAPDGRRRRERIAPREGRIGIEKRAPVARRLVSALGATRVEPRAVGLRVPPGVSAPLVAARGRPRVLAARRQARAAPAAVPARVGEGQAVHRMAIAGLRVLPVAHRPERRPVCPCPS